MPATCPKTGQVHTNLELVPNKAVKSGAKWCRENGVTCRWEGADANKSGEPVHQAVAAKAAQETLCMMVYFLMKKPSVVSFSPNAANHVVYEIRLLAKLDSDTRAFISEAGVVPLLVPLLYSENSGTQPILRSRLSSQKCTSC
jgi:hypothetical protein